MSEQNEWGFGQVLPVFLLAGPLVLLVITFQGKSRNANEGNDVSFLNRLRDALSDHKNGAAHECTLQAGHVLGAREIGERDNGEGVTELLLDIANGDMKCIFFELSTKANRHIVLLESQRDHRELVQVMTEGLESEQQRRHQHGRPHNQTLRLGAIEMRPLINTQRRIQVDHIEPSAIADISLEESEGGIIQCINQDAILQTNFADLSIRKSASAYITNSMVVGVLLFWLFSQVIVFTAFLLWNLSRSSLFPGPPTQFLPRFSVILFLAHPINFLMGIIISMYIDKPRFLSLQCLSFSALMAGMFTALIITFFTVGVDDISLISLSPLGIIILWFLYLAFRPHTVRVSSALP